MPDPDYPDVEESDRKDEGLSTNSDVEGSINEDDVFPANLPKEACLKDDVVLRNKEMEELSSNYAEGKTLSVKRLFSEVDTSFDNAENDEFDRNNAGKSMHVVRSIPECDFNLDDEFVFECEGQDEDLPAGPSCVTKMTVEDVSKCKGDVVDVVFDADVESHDDDDFTFQRIQRKKLRHSKRRYHKPVNVLDDKGIREAYEEFRSYLGKTRVFTPNKDLTKRKRPLGIGNRKKINEKLHPTSEKALGHIFTYRDSLLKFIRSKCPEFSMVDHFDFNFSKFQTVEHPLDWVEWNSEDDEVEPGRSLEKLKAHSQYRQFIRYKLDTSSLEEDVNLTKKRNIADGLDRIERSITSMKLFKKFGISDNQKKVERDHARLLLDPNKHLNEVECVTKWHKSEMAAKLANTYEKMYQEAVKNNKVGTKNLSKWAYYSIFNLELSDGQRVGTYKFTNGDFMKRQKLYLPDGYSDFKNLPKNWKCTEPPFEGAEPSLYILRLSGRTAGIKGSKATEVIISKRCFLLLVKYRALKIMLFPEEEG